MTTKIERTDHTAETLRRMACRCEDTGQARRLLAIAMVMDGMGRGEAARAAGTQAQTLKDWIVRYNGEGVDGLCDRPRSGRPGLMSAEQLAQFDRIVEDGPNVETDGVVRWRCIDLKAVIATRFAVSIAERTVGTLLNKRGFRRLSVRPRHPRTVEADQDAFKKTLQTPSRLQSRQPPRTNRSKSGSRMKPASDRKEP